jgi:hypothetical protein
VLRTGLRNKNSLKHVTVGTSPDTSRDLESPSGLCNQSPDRSHARSCVQSHAKSLTKSTALVPGHRPLRDDRTGPEIITSRSSFEDTIRELPLVRGSRIIPTHRPDGSHKRENGAIVHPPCIGSFARYLHLVQHLPRCASPSDPLSLCLVRPLCR